MSTYLQRAYAITDALERFTAFEIDAKRRDGKQLERILKTMETAVDELKAMSQTAKHSRDLNAADRALSLVATIKAIAREHSAILLKEGDALHAHVCQHAPEVDREYWLAIKALKVSGILRHEPSVVERLEAGGVLTWFNKEDGVHRIVNTNWLDSHGLIRRFVTEPWAGGYRCRFCRLPEVRGSNEIISWMPEKGPLLSEAPGRLQARSVHVHTRCAPHWQRWLAIAEQYATDAEADAADREAGRTGVMPPDPVEAVLEHKAPEGFIHTTKGD